MRVFFAIVLGIVLMGFVAGCGGQSAETPGASEKAEDPDPKLGENAERTSDEPATPEPPPAAVPAYEITSRQEKKEGPYDVVAYSVSTDATSEEDFRAITVELRAENPDKEAVLVTFYAEGSDANVTGTGEAFIDSQAASAILGSAYTKDDVEEIMDDDGLLIVATEDANQETTESVKGSEY
jgi:hypothetical protein